MSEPPAAPRERSPRLDRRLRLAALLVTLGLVVEALSFLSVHPAAFFAFLAPGALLVAVGVVVYLWTIVSHAEFSS